MTIGILAVLVRDGATRLDAENEPALDAAGQVWARILVDVFELRDDGQESRHD